MAKPIEVLHNKQNSVMGRRVPVKAPVTKSFWGVVVFLFNNYRFDFLFTVSYLLLTPFVMEYGQKYFLCRNQADCQVYGSFSLVLLNNMVTGWMFCGFVCALLFRRKISKLLMILMWPILIVHILVMAWAPLNYVKVTSENITVIDYINRVFGTVRPSQVRYIQEDRQTGVGKYGGGVTYFYSLVLDDGQKLLFDGGFPSDRPEVDIARRFNLRIHRYYEK